MRVKDLIKELECIDGDMVVKMSVDPEGNGFGILSDVEVSFVDESGEPIHPDDARGGEPQCVVLWP